jgi:hypothetical protein
LSQILYFKRKKRFTQNLVFRFFLITKKLSQLPTIYTKAPPVLKILYFHILNCQIWLNMRMNVCCLSNITELKKKTLHQNISRYYNEMMRMLMR